MRRLLPVAALVLVLVQGCVARAAAPLPAGGVPVGAVPADSLWVREELYFGASIQAGGQVSDSTWEGFLDREVTPRFPEGLTTLNAMGRYRYRSGEITREPGWIVILYYRASAENEAKVVALVEAYKKTYAQESVLRVTSPAWVRFYY